MLSEVADLELFKKTKADDTQAFEMLFNRHWHALFLFSNRLLRSNEEAKDVTQAVFLYLWEKRQQINIVGSVQGYLFQAARNKALNRLKELLETPDNIAEIQERLLPVLDDALQAIEYEELEQIIDAHINALPGRTRKIFKLSRYQQMTIEEIAQHLGLSEQTVKNQLSTALKMLRQHVLLELLVIYLETC